MGIILWGAFRAGSLACEQQRLRIVAAGLSWQAREFYYANCMGMKAAPLNPDGKQRDVEEWMPTYGKYSWRLQQVMMIVGVHELAQKDILEDRPLPTYSDELELRLMEEVAPPSIQPTPFGYRLCTYLLNQPSKPQ